MNSADQVATTIATLLVLTVLALGACSRQTSPGETEKPEPAICTEVGDALYDCRLPDGTRCIKYFARAISCDFHQGRKP